MFTIIDSREFKSVTQLKTLLQPINKPIEEDVPLFLNKAEYHPGEVFLCNLTNHKEIMDEVLAIYSRTVVYGKKILLINPSTDFLKQLVKDNHLFTEENIKVLNYA